MCCLVTTFYSLCHLAVNIPYPDSNYGNILHVGLVYWLPGLNFTEVIENCSNITLPGDADLVKYIFCNPIPDKAGILDICGITIDFPNRAAETHFQGASIDINGFVLNKALGLQELVIRGVLLEQQERGAALSHDLVSSLNCKEEGVRPQLTSIISYKHTHTHTQSSPGIYV